MFTGHAISATCLCIKNPYITCVLMLLSSLNMGDNAFLSPKTVAIPTATELWLPFQVKYSRFYFFRINEMPADVRELLSNSLNQIQYFISPYGASQFANIIKSKL